MTDGDKEHLYFNAIITDTTSGGEARITQRYSSGIVDKGDNYKLCIDKFYVMLTSIPLMIFNPMSNFYTVELSYNGIYSGRKSLTFVPTIQNVSTSSPEYYYIYHADEFLNMVNTALSTAFTTLGGLITLPVGSKAPFFAIDNELLKLYADTNYLTSNVTPINIFMNNNLTHYFYGIPKFVIGNLSGQGVASGRDVIYNVIDKKINVSTIGGTNYYVMVTNSGVDTLIKWNVCKGIYFASTMGVKNEIFPYGTLDLASKSIIANFDFVYTNNSKPLVVQYVLNSPYKIIDITTKNQINEFDLSVYWYDKYNNSYPVKLFNGDTVTIRILFEEK